MTDRSIDRYIDRQMIKNNQECISELNLLLNCEPLQSRTERCDRLSSFLFHTHDMILLESLPQTSNILSPPNMVLSSVAETKLDLKSAQLVQPPDYDAIYIYIYKLLNYIYKYKYIFKLWLKQEQKQSAGMDQGKDKFSQKSGNYFMSGSLFSLL